MSAVSAVYPESAIKSSKYRERSEREGRQRGVETDRTVLISQNNGQGALLIWTVRRYVAPKRIERTFPVNTVRLPL